MNIISIDNYRASQRIHPLSLLAQMSSRRANGCLRVSDGSTSWWIYLNSGDLVHASHSVAPFKRLERHLRQMSQDAPSLSPAIRGQVHQLFNTVPEREIEWLNPPDYQAIRWLVDKGHLTVPQAAILLESMAKEVFETFLQVREGVHELVDCPEFMGSSLLCLLELRPLVEACQRKLRSGTSVQAESFSYRSDANRSIGAGVSVSPTGVSSIHRDDTVASSLSPSDSVDQEEGKLEIEAASSADIQTSGDGMVQAPLVEQSLKPLTDVPSNPRPAFSSSTTTDLNPVQSPTEVVGDGMSNPPVTEFGKSATKPLNFRRPMGFDQNSGSQPTGSTSFLPRPTQNKTVRPSPSSSAPGKAGSGSLDNSSKLLREPPFREASSNKVSPNPAFYRDRDKLAPTSLPGVKDRNRSVNGYPPVGGSSALSSSKPQGEKLYKVACIDDSPMILHMIEAFLEDKSFSVIKINDPVRALMELMRAKPDIILLDITMPNLDGYELCALLRSRPDFRNTPIIMVTGSKGLIDRAKARLVKASGYLTKPFNQTQLLKMIFKLLK